MNFLYQGTVNEFIDRIKKHNAKYQVIINEEGFILKNGISEVSVVVEKCGYCKTKFSLGKYPLETLLVRCTCSSGMQDKNIIADIEQLCNAYSNKEVENILQDMPLLNEYALENRNALEGNAIIFRDHFLEDNLALLEAFVMSGVQREDILVLDKGDETLHRNEITNTFINEGFNTFVLDNACCDDKGKMLEALETIEDFCKVRANKGVIILDDGAIISKVLDKTKISNIIGIIELTEMGLRRISKLEEKIQYPILNVAKTNLKISITYVEIANSIFLKILNLLGANKIVGRNVLILGYGDLGCQLARTFKNYNTRVSVVDPDILKLINAAEYGYSTYLSPVEAIEKEQPFLIIGVSGYQSITKEMVEAMADGTFITAGATADLAIFDEYQKKGAQTFFIKDYGRKIKIDNKLITVLGNGRSINLYKSESIPNQSNDIFKTANYLATLFVKSNHGYLDVGLNNNFDEVLEKTDLYMRYYKRHFVKNKE